MHPTLLEGPFTVAEYHRLAELGILHEDDRVELLDGQVVVMSPIGPRHAGCVKMLNRLMHRALGETVTLGVQDPLVLSERAEPEPDLAVLAPRPDNYRRSHPHPEEVFLVIEVADSSLDRDHVRKIPLYAAAGIPEVWVVDLEGEGITLHRAPGPAGYGDITTASRGETISPRLLPHVSLSVDEILG
jgi:Uma2 family endonuclease